MISHIPGGIYKNDTPSFIVYCNEEYRWIMSGHISWTHISNYGFVNVVSSVFVE